MICANIVQTWKTRAIIPLNRAGAEPYFQSPPFPPQDSWIDSSFFVKTKLTKHDDPFAYSTRATYIPFNTLNTITLDIHPGRTGVCHIIANDPNPDGRMTTICFPDHPTKFRFFVCGVSIGIYQTFYYPFLQVCSASRVI